MKAVHLPLLMLLFVFFPAAAQELNGVTVEPAESTIGQPVRITVDFKVQANNIACGVNVAFGDGSSERIRVSADKLPLMLSHTYDRAGSFAVSVEGNLQIRGLSSVFPCFGSTRTAVINVRAEDFAEKQAAEKAAEEAALRKAASERQAAERAAQRATADRQAADKAAQKAAAERAAAERAAAAAAASRTVPERRTTTEQTAPEAGAPTPAPRSRPAAAEAPQKPAPVKARSAMDL